jgi:hypothetical protein
VQRVGLDGIDLPLWPPACDQLAENTENNPAAKRHRNRQYWVESQQPRQPHAGIELEEQPMQAVNASAHGGHDQTCDRANQRREHDQARFTRPHQGPQPSRYFQLTDDVIDQSGPPRAKASPRGL